MTNITGFHLGGGAHQIKPLTFLFNLELGVLHTPTHLPHFHSNFLSLDETLWNGTLQLCLTYVELLIFIMHTKVSRIVVLISVQILQYARGISVPPSYSPVFQYKYSHFSVFCMHFQYFSVFYKELHI